MKLSGTAPAIEWLSQFKPPWRGAAIDLIDAILLVNHDLFYQRLREALVERATPGHGVVGLYAERELPKRNGVPNRLFKETTRRPRRAFGPGPEPVQPTRTIDPEVGSEGIISWLVTELCREHPDWFVSHPGPDQIREHGIHTFLLVTDFIGTGKQASTYIEAAWRIWSVKSWCSRHQFHFEVVAYSGTEKGCNEVRHHAASPEVRIVTPCPTIETVFDPVRAKRIKDLCERHDPVSRDPIASLGYGGVGALLAFAHGCPNNAPRILYSKRGRRWKPLFPRRVTASGVRAFAVNPPTGTESIAERLTAMGHERLARSPWLSRISAQGRSIIVLLAALGRGPRLDDALAARTGLTLPEVHALLALVVEFGWVDAKRRLTDAGQSQLVHAKGQTTPYGELLPESDVPYYPRSLRAPK
jgi:hypothetical protein